MRGLMTGLPKARLVEIAGRRFLAVQAAFRLLAVDPQEPDTVYAGGPWGLFAISF